MAKAKKLPSGHYRVRVFDPVLKKQVSFTEVKKADAERKAKLYQLEMHNQTERCNLTFGQVASQFFENRTKAYSEGSIREYKRILAHDLQGFSAYKVGAITNEMLQSFANEQALTKAPRTVKNIYGLAISIIHSVLPSKSFNIRVGRKVHKKEIELPPRESIEKLLKMEMSEDMRIAIELALYGGLRRAEICALQASDLTGTILHISKALVQDENKNWVVKAPKTELSDRYVELPEYLAAKLRRTTDKVVKLTPNSITNDFPRIARRAGVKITFHQLRHWSASYLHDCGVSEAEILKRFGWSQSYVFRNVYRHNFNFDKSNEAIGKLVISQN